MTTYAKHRGSSKRHLSALELKSLLSDDEESAALRDAALHLDDCETCQWQLTTLAADRAWWTEVRQFLDGPREPRWEPDLSQASLVTRDFLAGRPAIDDQVLSLLGAPNHPEMLGRLGRYDIERVIGSGGMGIVLKAHDSELNRPIAIKLLAPHLAHVGAARERFAREGRAAAAVVNEHVVAIYNVEADGVLPFLTMQYVPGRSLQARVDGDGPLGVEEILRIGVQAATGLAAAHAQGLVHRDVKPSNILLQDSVERAVLTDFGLARAIDDASLTQTGVIAGTPHYMSPEQAVGGQVDLRSDLFGLGAVLYFMATGHPPFRAASALAVLHRICRDKHRPVWHSNKNVPQELGELIDQLLEKRLCRRPASAEEVRDQLAAILSHVQQYGLGRRSLVCWRGKRGRRRLVAALALLAGASAAGGAVWMFAVPSRSDRTQSSTSVEIETKENSDFFGHLEAVRAALKAAERDTFYLSRHDAWRQEIESIEQDLDKLESEDHVSVSSQGDLR